MYFCHKSGQFYWCKQEFIYIPRACCNGVHCEDHNGEFLRKFLKQQTGWATNKGRRGSNLRKSRTSWLLGFFFVLTLTSRPHFLHCPARKVSRCNGKGWKSRSVNGFFPGKPTEGWTDGGSLNKPRPRCLTRQSGRLMIEGSIATRYAALNEREIYRRPYLACTRKNCFY